VLIGILSDTHGRAHAMAAGVAALRDRGAEFFIHCGDVGSEEVLDHLAGTRAAFVFGNTDFDRASLTRYAEDLNITCYGNAGDFELDGKRFALLHGDDERLKRRILDAQQHDYLLQGHTHIPLDERVGRTRVINPGALHRAKVKTVALLDTKADIVSFLTIDGV